MIKALEKLLAAYGSESVNEPYAFSCNKKTFEKIALEMREDSVFEEFKKTIPSEMYYSGIPIFIEETVPKDKVLIIDKETYLKIKEANAAFWDKNRKIMIDAAGKHESN